MNKKPSDYQSISKRGFTLLELLVVVMILGILVVIGLRSFQTSQMKARDTKRKSEIEQLVRALEMYRNDKGSYPLGDNSGKVLALSWGESFYDADHDQTIYMAKLPRITRNIGFYYQAYEKSSSGFVKAEMSGGAEAQAYRIYTYIENSQDGSILQEPTEINCGSDTKPIDCNFVVSSTNLSQI